ncbi:hypothetical protein [Streptomyces sp. NPDC059894]|uniref:hypothetical protein n=1 Tax=unclassified Streptomyces TaxID=2593676 RepID=UPI003663BBAA
MSWTRGSLSALAVCVLLLTGSAGCGSGDAAEGGGAAGTAAVSPEPVGEVLEDTDGDGRHYREVGEKDAPDVRVEVEPDARGGWDVRLEVRNFRFSPAGTAARAVAGRGIARLFVDDRAVADLRGPSHDIPAGYLPHGTHQVTARLYADDGTVWAVDGEPVESTADITASEPDDASPGPTGASAGSTGASSGLTGTSAGLTGASSGPTGASAGSTDASSGLTGTSAGLTGASSGPTGASAGSTGATPGPTGASAGLTSAFPGSAGTSPEAGGASPGPGAGVSPAFLPALSAPGTCLRTEGRGSPERGGKAS